MKTLYETIFDTTGALDDFARPKSNADLKDLIRGYIDVIKPDKGDEVDLNWIDISRVDDLRQVFNKTDYIPVIDKWDITHVKNFDRIFAGNKYITRSPLPVLQEKLLGPRCYAGMFILCTSLVEPPELPAIKLTESCYSGMFEGCTSLERAPQLPAKELIEGCYISMFADCTSLVEPPELPAIKLTESCYSGMFEGCTSLQVAPDLPAKKLVKWCYADMFKNCSSLKTEAKIPTSVNLNGYTALEMYEGCPNIK